MRDQPQSQSVTREPLANQASNKLILKAALDVKKTPIQVKPEQKISEPVVKTVNFGLGKINKLQASRDASKEIALRAAVKTDRTPAEPERKLKAPMLSKVAKVVNTRPEKQASSKVLASKTTANFHKQDGQNQNGKSKWISLEGEKAQKVELTPVKAQGVSNCVTPLKLVLDQRESIIECKDAEISKPTAGEEVPEERFRIALAMPAVQAEVDDSEPVPQKLQLQLEKLPPKPVLRNESLTERKEAKAPASYVPSANCRKELLPRSFSKPALSSEAHGSHYNGSKPFVSSESS